MELHFLPCFHPKGFNCKSFSHSNFLSDFKLIPFYTHSSNMTMNISQYKRLLIAMSERGRVEYLKYI